ncbi:RNA polymerase sigma-70 factor [Reichenbachiella versicolor]|uniref:RNA polymerase sigma-70 factor n=1 Tax=Reichenbachiella versicolor TaxID=1821036 RepID=UPI000D6E8880|nr:RNA polymerase sigma-70 factor [Reichenbachiella versicolor]
MSTSITDISNSRTFEKVFKEYYSPLTNFAYQYLRDHEEAEEIVQETFSKVWSKKSDLEIKTNIKSYLFGAVRNACLNNLKHQKIIREHENYEMHRDHSDSTDFMELDDLQKQIDSALEELPEKCRQIFIMSRYEEKKYREIADELKISVKTVETQMSRALKVMRKALQQYVPQFVFWVLWAIEKNLSG